MAGAFHSVSPARKAAANCGRRSGRKPARSTLWKEPDEVIARINVRVRGWIGYFHYANSSRVFGKMQWQMRERMRRWLWKKHAKTQAHYGDAYSNERLHDHYGLVNFPMHTKWQNS